MARIILQLFLLIALIGALQSAPPSNLDTETTQQRKELTHTSSEENSSEESNEKKDEIQKRPVRDVKSVQQDHLSVIPKTTHESDESNESKQSSEKSDDIQKRPVRQSVQQDEHIPKIQTLPAILPPPVTDDLKKSKDEITRPSRDTQKDVKDLPRPQTLPAILPAHTDHLKNPQETIARPARDTKDLSRPQTLPAILPAHITDDLKKSENTAKDTKDLPKPQTLAAILPANDLTKPQEANDRPARDTPKDTQDLHRPQTLPAILPAHVDLKKSQESVARPARDTPKETKDLPKPQTLAAILPIHDVPADSHKPEARPVRETAIKDSKIKTHSDVSSDDSDESDEKKDELPKSHNPPSSEFGSPQASVYRVASDFDKTPSNTRPVRQDNIQLPSVINAHNTDSTETHDTSSDESGSRLERENTQDDKPKFTPGLVTSNQYHTPSLLAATLAHPVDDSKAADAQLKNADEIRPSTHGDDKLKNESDKIQSSTQSETAGSLSSAQIKSSQSSSSNKK